MNGDERELLRWLVQQVQDQKLSEEFTITRSKDAEINISGPRDGWTYRKLILSLDALDHLCSSGYLQKVIEYVVVLTTDGRWEQREKSRKYKILTDKAYRFADENIP